MSGAASRYRRRPDGEDAQRDDAGGKTSITHHIYGIRIVDGKDRASSPEGTHSAGQHDPGAGILEGDLLAVHRTAEARPGQIVVARIEDEVTVKRFRRRGREIVLSPENPEFEPIVVDPRQTSFTIEGIGVGLVRGGKL